MRSDGHPNLVLATCILASSLAFVDGSVTNVALPAIGSALSASSAQLRWVINAYLLPLSALLLLGGAMGDRFGRQRLLVGGTVLFGLSSLACALSPSLPVLLSARAAQGVGSAMLMPNSLAILATTFTGRSRGRATGIWASMGGVMVAGGPVLGGWLIDSVGWRAIFLINLPLALGAIVLSLIYVRDTRERDLAAIDIPGGAIATLSLFALTFGLTIGSGSSGWTAEALAATGLGLTLMLGFVGIEKLRGERAMMPLAMFASPTFIGLTVLTVLLYGALGAVTVLIPYFLIRETGYSAAQAGLSLLPLAVVIAALSPIMGQLAGRIGSRLPLSIGAFVVAGGLVLQLRMGASARYWADVLPAIFVVSLGMSGAVAPLTTAVLGSVDSRHTGSASGFNSAAARTGGLIATALLGGVLGTSDGTLVSGFHIAAVACAIGCIAAGLAAFLLIKGGTT
jgi:EmrB/QacA subfamily drug resistance transporter